MKFVLDFCKEVFYTILLFALFGFIWWLMCFGVALTLELIHWMVS